jgi:hypothetical protein
MCRVYEDLPLCCTKKHADEAGEADPCVDCAERIAAITRRSVEAKVREELERRAARRRGIQRLTLMERQSEEKRAVEALNESLREAAEEDA